MKFNLPMVCGLSYITYFMLMGASDIGNMHYPETTGWDMPFVIALFLSVPFILGYMAGKESKEK